MDNRISCPACESEEFLAEVENVNGYSVLRCLNCDLEFSYPMINLGGDWYDRAYIIRHSVIDTRIRDYYKWTISSLPIHGTLLDIGCGEGTFVNYARKKGFDAYGIDFSKKAIELGKMHYGLNNLFNCSLSELKNIISKQNFDIITFFEVLEHIDSPKEFINEIKGLLKKNGYAAGSVPFKDRWPFREFNDYPPHHLTRWGEKSLRIFFQKNGFEIVKIIIGSRLNSYLIFLGYLLRILLYSFFGMYKKGLHFSNLRIKSNIEKLYENQLIKKVFSLIDPRELRDILFLPILIITFPFVFPFFKGYNIMFIIKRVD